MSFMLLSYCPDLYELLPEIPIWEVLFTVDIEGEWSPAFLGSTFLTMWLGCTVANLFTGDSCGVFCAWLFRNLVFDVLRRLGELVVSRPTFRLFSSVARLGLLVCFGRPWLFISQHLKFTQ